MTDKRQPFGLDDVREPPAPVVNFLRRTGARRVLDWGCGRGVSVLWLRQNGFDACGVDVVDDYLEAGRRSFAPLGEDPAALLAMTDIDNTDPFDAVVSYMVLEHVQDLDQTATAMRRCVRPGGSGLHLFPARWRVVEPHIGVPLAHWFNGSVRRAVITTAVSLGCDRRSSVGLGDDSPKRDVVDAFAGYMDSNTVYRSPRAIARSFQRAGFETGYGMEDHRLSRPHGPLPERVTRATLGRVMTSHLQLTG